MFIDLRIGKFYTVVGLIAVLRLEPVGSDPTGSGFGFGSEKNFFIGSGSGNFLRQIQAQSKIFAYSKILKKFLSSIILFKN